MTTHSPVAATLLAILCAACAPTPSVEAVAAVPVPEVAPTPSAAFADSTDSDAEGAADTLECRCDVIAFEGDGPPLSRCELSFDDDGIGTLTSERSKPAFTARLLPIPGKKRKVDYLYEGEFDFACTMAWCGHQELSVLAVAEQDYRVTVARSDDGPPELVLYVTCLEQ